MYQVYYKWRNSLGDFIFYSEYNSFIEDEEDDSDSSSDELGEEELGF